MFPWVLIEYIFGFIEREELSMLLEHKNGQKLNKLLLKSIEKQLSTQLSPHDIGYKNLLALKYKTLNDNSPLSVNDIICINHIFLNKNLKSIEFLLKLSKLSFEYLTIHKYELLCLSISNPIMLKWIFLNIELNNSLSNYEEFFIVYSIIEYKNLNFYLYTIVKNIIQNEKIETYMKRMSDKVLFWINETNINAMIGRMNTFKITHHDVQNNLKIFDRLINNNKHLVRCLSDVFKLSIEEKDSILKRCCVMRYSELFKYLVEKFEVSHANIKRKYLPYCKHNPEISMYISTKIQTEHRQIQWKIFKNLRIKV